VSGNSSQYNYSSGRLDHVPYQRGLKIDRNDMRLLVLDRVFRAYLQEAVLIPGLIPSVLPPVEECSWCWGWDGWESIDAVKDATADDMRLKNGTSTYAEILAEYGQNWQEQFDQLAREKREAEKRGLPWPVLAATTTVKGQPGPDQPGSDTAPPPTPAAESMRQAVGLALDEVGIPENVQAEVLEALGPTFAALNRAGARPGRNGHTRSAGGVA
jgi:capsid protein